VLVLSRKSQERIQIGDQITISVLAVKGNVVRIGIEAPTNIHIVRGELPPLDKTAKTTESSASSTDRSVATVAVPQSNDAQQDLCSSRVMAQRVRVSANRLPSLQSRLHRRMDVLKAEVLATT
jgi:carbon storage regulator